MKKFMMVSLFALTTAAAAQAPVQGPVPADACPITERGRWENGKRVVPDRYMRLVSNPTDKSGGF